MWGASGGVRLPGWVLGVLARLLPQSFAQALRKCNLVDRAHPYQFRYICTKSNETSPVHPWILISFSILQVIHSQCIPLSHSRLEKAHKGPLCTR